MDGANIADFHKVGDDMPAQGLVRICLRLVAQRSFRPIVDKQNPRSPKAAGGSFFDPVLILRSDDDYRLTVTTAELPLLPATS